MRIRFRYLLVSLIVGGALLIAYGCSQHDDVVQPQEMATITLRPQNLPTLDTAYYVYELWMVAVDDNTHDSSFTSLGRFIWDNYGYSFRDTDGNKIDSIYEVPEPWLSYDYIMVSVENRYNDAAGPSGAFMLVDEVADPVSRPIIMKFPASVFDVTGNYFVATPTDDELNYYNENKGIWICSRAASEFTNWDTLGVTGTSLTAYPNSNPTPEDSLKPDTVNIVWPPDSVWTVIDTIVVFGYDTMYHRRIHLEYVIDTIPEYSYKLDVDFIVRTDCSYGSPCLHLGDFGYWNYLGPLQEMPNIEPCGWRFSAYVLLEDQPSGYNSGLGLSTMSPFGFDGQHNYTGDTNWVVLPLGPFFRADSADLSNKYISYLEVPNYPGEDFVMNASPKFDNLNLRLRTTEDATGGEFGSVIIGMEPIPSSSIIIDTTSNFPLFFMVDFLPYYEEGSGLVPDFHNYCQYLPEIEVGVAFHD